jgi:CIC family chloride channel protein
MFLVRMAPSGWSCLTRDLLERLTKEGKGALTLASVLPTQRLPFLYPDLPLDSALRQVSQAELIPVVNRADLRMLEGVVTRDDVLSRYQADAVAD